MKIIKRRLMWIIELIVWMLVLLLISSGIMFAKYNYKKNFDTYQIFLHDVDGLIVGSPVRYMGIQIGYVNQLNITGEDIFVNFIITDTNVKIPRGANATVEFSGLGGSKSLELYPPSPNTSENLKLIVPQPPKRIHDSLGLLNDMLESAVDITYSVTRFMEKVGMIKLQVKNGKHEVEDAKTQIRKEAKQNIKFVSEKSSADDLLNKCNNWLDSMQKQCDKFNEKVNKKAGQNGKNDGKSDVQN